MASSGTIIGPETRVRGRITGATDIEIQGHLEGDLHASGEVRIDASGTVAADVHGRRVIVRGAVKGNLSADESIHLEEGARVVGDIHAPRVAIAPGGLVRGHVETGKGDGKHAPAASHAARAAAAAPARHATPSKAHAPAKPARHGAQKPVSKSRITLGGGKSKAPAPVVPVLKKGTKAALTKKR